MNRNPAAETTLARPWREFAKGANGSVVGRGADPARVAASRTQHATMQGLTPLPLCKRRNATIHGLTPWRAK